MKKQQQTNKQTKKELDYDSLTGSAHYFTGRDIHFAGLCLPITSTPYFSFPACIDWSGAASPSRLSAHAHNQPPRHSHFIFTARQDKLPCQKKKKGGGRGGGRNPRDGNPTKPMHFPGLISTTLSCCEHAGWNYLWLFTEQAISCHQTAIQLYVLWKTSLKTAPITLHYNCR